jgi:hypothetical protein
MKKITGKDLKREICRQIRSTGLNEDILLCNLQITGKDLSLDHCRIKFVRGRTIHLHFIDCTFDNSFVFNNTQNHNFNLSLNGCSFKKDLSYDSNGINPSWIHFENIIVEETMSVAGVGQMYFSGITAKRFNLSGNPNQPRCTNIKITLGRLNINAISVQPLNDEKRFSVIIEKCHESLIGIVRLLFPSISILEIYTEKGSFFGSG